MNCLKSILIGVLFAASVLALYGCVAATAGHSEAKGRGYFMRECIKCHRYFMPSERSAEEWLKILAVKKNKVSLTGTQFQELSDYVITESKAAKTP